MSWVTVKVPKAPEPLACVALYFNLKLSEMALVYCTKTPESGSFVINLFPGINQRHFRNFQI
jgi:hypothetical protein